MGLTAILSTACSVIGIGGEEQPRYRVVLVQGDQEVREYQPYLVATTRVEGTFREAQGNAFRLLAAYIFGANEGQSEIAMTAPVVQARAAQGEVIPMTAPVVQGAEGDAWTMQFVMPSRYALTDLPQPSDPRIRFDTVPGKLVATIRYAWGYGEARNQAKAEELLAWLAALRRYRPVSGPRFAGYNPPWTLPFLRRNEVWIDVEEQGGSP